MRAIVGLQASLLSRIYYQEVHHLAHQKGLKAGTLSQILRLKHNLVFVYAEKIGTVIDKLHPLELVSPKLTVVKRP